MREKWLFTEAYMLLGLMRLAVSLLPFKWLIRSLKQSTGTIAPPALLPEQKRIATSVARLVPAAAGGTPWESVCLVQALTAQRMLKRRGIPGVFYLGVMYDADTEKKMKAHAWLLSDDIIVTGSGFESFTVLSSFGWQ